MIDSHAFTEPPRSLVRLPERLVGRGVCIALLGRFFPVHPELLCKQGRRVEYVGRDGAPYDPREVGEGQPGRGGHDLGVAARAGGNGSASVGVYEGVAPRCNLILCSQAIRNGRWDGATGPEGVDEQLESVVRNVERFRLRLVCVGTKGHLAGPLVPWQWDSHRRRCEQLGAMGVIVVSGVGNCPVSFCPQSLAPTVLSVGGTLLPRSPADPVREFHSPEGETFEGKHVPEVLAPAEPVIVPAIDAACQCGVPGVPVGHTVVEGSSFAAPFVAGLLACVIEAHPDLPATVIQQATVHAGATVSARFGGADVGMPDFPSVQRAISEPETVGPSAPFPFADYETVQSMTWDRRVALMRQSPDEAENVILNSIPQTPPRQYVGFIGELFRKSPNARLRAGIVLLLAREPNDDRTAGLLNAALKDPSPVVLGSALDVLRRDPSLPTSREGRIAGLINHPDARVGREACMVAEVRPDECFVEPLIEGMQADLEKGNLGTFFRRRTALKRITGKTRWPGGRKMLPGECVYSAYWMERQRECARNWRQMLHGGADDA